LRGGREEGERRERIGGILENRTEKIWLKKENSRKLKGTEGIGHEVW
jgi:hypothetical protein